VNGLAIEAWETKWENMNSIVNYEKSLQLNPVNPPAVNILNQIKKHRNHKKLDNSRRMKIKKLVTLLMICCLCVISMGSEIHDAATAGDLAVVKSPVPRGLMSTFIALIIQRCFIIPRKDIAPMKSIFCLIK
jgi:hypothetical protein